MLQTVCIAIGILIIFIIAIIIKNQLINIDGFNIRIEESSKSIQILQEEAIDLLSKISKKVKEQTNDKIFKDLPKMKNKSLDMFEIDKYLMNLNNELKDTLEYTKVNFSNDEYNLISLYKNNKIELAALKNYYNNCIIKYNNYIKSIKRFFIKILKKLKEKEIFDIKKEVEFEILKTKDNSN